MSDAGGTTVSGAGAPRAPIGLGADDPLLRDPVEPLEEVAVAEMYRSWVTRTVECASRPGPVSSLDPAGHPFCLWN